MITAPVILSLQTQSNEVTFKTKQLTTVFHSFGVVYKLPNSLLKSFKVVHKFDLHHSKTEVVNKLPFKKYYACRYNSNLMKLVLNSYSCFYGIQLDLHQIDLNGPTSVQDPSEHSMEQ